MGKYSWMTRVIDSKSLFPDAPRGYRNNNPLNIRFSERNAWQGILGRDKEKGGMCVFSAQRYGIRAVFRLFETYQKKYNKCSVREMISKWAPKKENNTEAYIKRVCEYMKCEPEFIPHFGAAAEMYDCIRMVKAMCEVENGAPHNKYITDHDFETGWRLAFPYTSQFIQAEPDLNVGFDDLEEDEFVGSRIFFDYDEICKNTSFNGTL